MNNNEYYEEYFPGTARQSTLFDIANAIPDPPPKGGGGGGETDNPTDQITDSTDSSEGPPIRDCLNTDDLNACELDIQNNNNANGDCFSFDSSIYVPQQQSPLIVGNNFDPRKITDFEITLGSLQQASTATTVDDLSEEYGGSPGIKYFKTKSVQPSAQILNTISPLLNTEKNKEYTINGMPVIAAKSYVNSWGFGFESLPQVVYDFRVSMSCFNWNNPKYADNVSGTSLNLGFCPQEVKSNCIDGNCCNGAVYEAAGGLCDLDKITARQDASFAYLPWIYHPGKTQFQELTTSSSTGLEPTWIPTPIVYSEGQIDGIEEVNILLSFGQIFSEAVFRECIDHDTGTIIVRLQKIAYQYKRCTPFYSYLTSLDVLTPSTLCNGHSISQRPKTRELSTCGVPEEYGKITSALNDRSLYFASHDLSVSDFDSFLTSNSTPTTFISGHFDGDYINTPPPNREEDGFAGDLSHTNWVVKDYVTGPQATNSWEEVNFPDNTGGSITNTDFNGLTFAGITHNDRTWEGYNCDVWPIFEVKHPLNSMTKYTIQIPYDCIISFEYAIQHIFQFPTDSSGFDRETRDDMAILAIESDDGFFVLETGGPSAEGSIPGLGNQNTTLKTGYFTKTFTANETFSVCMLKMAYSNGILGCTDRCAPTCQGEPSPVIWAYGGDILNISNFSVKKSGNLCELTVGNTDNPTEKLIRTGQVATAIVETEYNNSIDNSGYDNSWDGDNESNELGLTNGINGLRILETLVVESGDPDLHVDKGIWVYNHTDNVWVGNCAGQTTIVNGINLNRVYPYWAIRSTCTPYVQAWNGENCGITNCENNSDSFIGFNPALHQCEETGVWRYPDKQYKFVSPGCPHDYNCCCQISFDYIFNPLSWFRDPSNKEAEPRTYSCSDEVVLGTYGPTGWNRHCADLARRFCGVDVYCDTIHFPPAGYGAKPKAVEEILPIEEVQKATVDYVHFLNFENYNASDFVDANGKVKLLYVFYGSKPLIGLKRQEANSIYPTDRLMYQAIPQADLIGEGAGYYILDKDGPSPIDSPFYVYLNRVRVEPISGENKIESTDADYSVNGPVFYVGDSPHPEGEVFGGGETDGGDDDGGGSVPGS